MKTQRSEHQCHELVPTGDFELAEDGVKMLLHGRHAQTCRVGYFLIASSVTNQACEFLFARGQSGQMWQSHNWGLFEVARIPALNQKMRPSNGIVELFKMN